MIRTKGTFVEWKRDVLAQYPKALISTARKDQAYVKAVATQPQTWEVISEWSKADPA